MHIFARTLTRKIIPLEEETDDTFEYIKELMFDIEGIPVQSQRYIYLGNCV